MRQVVPIEGETLIEYVHNYNETMAELSRVQILNEKHIDDLHCLVYYETQEEVDKVIEAVETRTTPEYVVQFDEDETEAETETIRIDLKVCRKKNRYCCECDNYDWGKSCPYRDGVVRIMDDACSMFNVIIEGRF